jgi:hypothetical protein
MRCIPCRTILYGSRVTRYLVLHRYADKICISGVIMGIIGMNLTHSQWVLSTRWTWLLTLLLIGLLGFVGQVIIVLLLRVYLKCLHFGNVCIQ